MLFLFKAIRNALPIVYMWTWWTVLQLTYTFKELEARISALLIYNV